MYRLPLDADLSFLVGADLLQVCVGENEIILNFERGRKITLLAEFSVVDKEGSLTTYEDAKGGATALLPLLGDKVCRAVPTQDGGLSLEFKSGQGVQVPDRSDEFESFWITDGHHQIIV